LARELRRRGKAMPVRLFASSSVAPQFHTGLPEFASLDGAAVAPPVEIGAEICIAAWRADATMNRVYRYQSDSPFEFPISVYGGLDDDLLTEIHHRAWQQHTVLPITLRMFPGDHFFIRDQAALVIRSVADDLGLSPGS
jgi:surfactin synthase thioesterase subunit